MKSAFQAIFLTPLLLPSDASAATNTSIFMIYPDINIDFGNIQLFFDKLFFVKEYGYMCIDRNKNKKI